MARTSIRATVKQWIVDELRNVAPTMNVDSGWPGRNLKRDHAWVDRVTGTVEFNVVMAGRKQRDDKFTVRVIFQASQPGESIAETDERVEAMYAHLEDIFADDPGLGTMDGVVDATLGTVEGPVGEQTKEGAVSFIFADIDVHSRLS